MASSLEILNAANIQFLRNAPIFMAIQASPQTVANTTITTITWPAPTIDNYTGWSAGTPTRYTGKVAGYYTVTGSVSFATNATGNRLTLIQKNGSTIWQQGTFAPTTANTSNVVTPAALVFLNGTTDYVEVACYQTSGGNLNTVTGAGNTQWAIQWTHA